MGDRSCVGSGCTAVLGAASAQLLGGWNWCAVHMGSASSGLKKKWLTV